MLACLDGCLQKATSEYISAYTIHEIWKIVRQAFDQAVRWGLMKENPAQGVKHYSKKNRERDFWTSEEFMKAADLCTDPLLCLAMHLSFACTLRLGEILGLRWEDISIDEEALKNGKACLFVRNELQRVNRDILEKLDGRDVTFRFPVLIKGTKTQLVLKKTKTEKSQRTVYIPYTVARLLEERRRVVNEQKELFKEDYIDYGLIFCNSLGRPVEASYMEHALSRLIKDNNLKPVVFHSFRHYVECFKMVSLCKKVR